MAQPYVFVVLSLGVVSLGCGGPGSTANFTAKGRLGGQSIDLRVGLTSGGGGMTDGTNFGDNRHVANQLAVIGGLPEYSSVQGTVCPVTPCPDAVELLLWTPTPIIHAGPWPLPSGSFLNLQHDLTKVMSADLGTSPQPYQLDFGEPQFSPSGRVVMHQPGTFVSPSGADLQLEGTFNLEYQCHTQNTYFRHCGQAKGADGTKNPLNLPYVEDTCPRELVAPYEAAPRWVGNTLHLGELSVDCRETEGSLNGGQRPVLCYSKRTNVVAGGCTWAVHFVTDGLVYQFAVAGFADAACPVKTCNTSR